MQTAHPPLAAPRILALLLLALLATAGPAWAHDGGTSPAAPAAPAAPKAPAAQATDPLVIGVFPIPGDCVVDGDTFRIDAHHPTVRILGLDTEEIFHRERDRKAAEADFAAYAKAKRGSNPRPVKYGTPAGEAAKAFARALVAKATAMRLERDGADAPLRGRYGRILAHVILVTPDGDVNYQEAVLRAGWSPYFVKYGRCQRYGARYEAAQKEARAAHRGIWGTTGPAHYPDYTERLAWWNARADQVDRWRAVARQPGHVTLGAPSADKALAALVGRDATVFGLFERELTVHTADKRIFLLSHEPKRGFPLVFFDPNVPKTLDMDAVGSRYLTVHGKVTLYQGRPEMVIERADQISTR
jgi:micrococcal nuclease